MSLQVLTSIQTLWNDLGTPEAERTERISKLTNATLMCAREILQEYQGRQAEMKKRILMAHSGVIVIEY